MNIYSELSKINSKPKPFEFYTTPELWNDDYISSKMLGFHLNPDCDLASRNKAFISKSVSWLISKFNITTSTNICDFGCGPGLYTTEFAKQGAVVTGIDLSKRSLEYAKTVADKDNLQINYVLKNYLDYTTDKKFDLITMIFCDFCVLNHNQRKSLLNKFFDYLSPDGYIIFDVNSLDLFTTCNEIRTYEYSDNDGFWSQSPYFVFQNTFKYISEQLILHKYTIFEDDKIKESYNWLQCYSIETITKLLRESGLAVVEYYSNVAGEIYQQGSKEIAIVAKKL